jgi:hypothetical protein
MKCTWHRASRTTRAESGIDLSVSTEGKPLARLWTKTESTKTNYTLLESKDLGSDRANIQTALKYIEMVLHSAREAQNEIDQRIAPSWMAICPSQVTLWFRRFARRQGIKPLLAGCLRGMIENGNVPNNPPWGPSMFLNGYSSNSK